MGAIGTALGLPFARSGGFVGALDLYTTNLAGVWSVSRRLLSSYTGPLIRVRRSSDNTEQDIGFAANGLLDVTALNTFVGGGNWFLRTAYNQQGSSGRDVGQSSAANQPQGAVGGDGIPYVYAPGAGFTTYNLVTSAFAGTYTNNTFWSVGQGGAAGTIDFAARNNLGAERRKKIGPTQVRNDLSGVGTNATLSGTTLSRYSVIQQVNGGGNRIHDGPNSTTGTIVAATGTTLYLIGIGYGGGGVNWMQNAQWLGSAFWADDIGNSAVDALQVVLKPLFNTQ